MVRCICGHHPALPGIPSDERIDDPLCPRHHPENIAQTLHVQGEASAFFEYSEEARHFFDADELEGFSSEKFAEIVKGQWDRWVDGIDVEWSLSVKVDDQSWVTVNI